MGFGLAQAQTTAESLVCIVPEGDDLEWTNELYNVPGQGALIRSLAGLHFFSLQDGQVTKVGPENMGDVFDLHDVPARVACLSAPDLGFSCSTPRIDR